VKVRTSTQPGVLAESLGVAYSQFTRASGLALKDDPFGAGANNRVEGWFELVEARGAEALATYDHPHWGRYAAVTLNRHQAGWGAYIGCQPELELTVGALRALLQRTGQYDSLCHDTWPVVRKSGTNDAGHRVVYYLNYADQSAEVTHRGAPGQDVLTGRAVKRDERLTLDPWGVGIVEERTD